MGEVGNALVADGEFPAIHNNLCLLGDPVQRIIVGWANGDGTVTPISKNSRQYIDMSEPNAKGITYNG
jgi:hypothetical protein